MCRGTNNIEYTCVSCGYVVEGDSAEPDIDGGEQKAPNTARLRIVGVNSNQLQPDLYRSCVSNPEMQKKQICEEYCRYRNTYIASGGRALPLDACTRASDYYNEVQQLYVKRSQNKKSIMAACYYHTCLELGFAPSTADVAAFMQLPHRGIARGMNFIRSLVADGQMSINMDINPCGAEIITLFAHFDLDGAEYGYLRNAVYNIVQASIEYSIGTRSILRSKVAGATFVVLKRCSERRNNPELSTPIDGHKIIPKPIGINEFCRDRIRKNTVERFISQLNAYHSHFAKYYKAAKIISSPPI
jgi:hypothetical protein